MKLEYAVEMGTITHTAALVIIQIKFHCSVLFFGYYSSITVTKTKQADMQ